LLLFYGLLCNSFERFIIRCGNNIAFSKPHFIKEAIIGRGAEAKMASKSTFGGFTKDVGRRVPKHPSP
jgi:hypothetical protein